MHQKTSGGRTSPDPLGQLKALHYTFIRNSWPHSLATVRDVMGGEGEKGTGMEAWRVKGKFYSISPLPENSFFGQNAPKNFGGRAPPGPAGGACGWSEMGMGNRKQ